MTDVKQEALTMMITRAKTSFASLIRPIKGEYGETYSITLEFDLNDERDPNLALLGKLNGLLTRGGPVDVKDAGKLKSTGIARLYFNSPTKIPVYDSDGELVPEAAVPNVGAGSIVNVEFRVSPTKLGTFKYISGVQIVNLVPYVPEVRTVSFKKDGAFKASALHTSEETLPNFSNVFADKK